MNNEKKTSFRPALWFSLMVLMLLIYSSPLFSQPPGEVYAAAVEGLPLFLSAIPQGMENGYGFDSRDEFGRSILGEPYRMQTVDPEKILDDIPYENYIVELPEWRFPVICDGTIKTLLTVANMNGSWRAVAIGGAGLARELDALEKEYGFDTGNTRKAILRLFQIEADMLSLSDAGERLEEGLFIPLFSAEKMTGLSRQEVSFYLFEELLPVFKDKFKAVWPFLENDPQNDNGKRRK